MFGNRIYFAGFFNAKALAKAASKNDHYECSLSNDSSRSFSRNFLAFFVPAFHMIKQAVDEPSECGKIIYTEMNFGKDI